MLILSCGAFNIILFIGEQEHLAAANLVLKASYTPLFTNDRNIYHKSILNTDTEYNLNDEFFSNYILEY